jgi:hypothetical protein
VDILALFDTVLFVLNRENATLERPARPGDKMRTGSTIIFPARGFAFAFWAFRFFLCNGLGDLTFQVTSRSRRI